MCDMTRVFEKRGYGKEGEGDKALFILSAQLPLCRQTYHWSFKLRRSVAEKRFRQVSNDSRLPLLASGTDRNIKGEKLTDSKLHEVHRTALRNWPWVQQCKREGEHYRWSSTDVQLSQKQAAVSRSCCAFSSPSRT